MSLDTKYIQEIKDDVLGYVIGEFSELAKKSKAVEKKNVKDKEATDFTLRDRYDNALSVWKSNGYADESLVQDFDSKIKIDDLVGHLKDAVSTPDASVILRKVVSTVVKEAVEPIMIGAQLFNQIRLEAGQQITFPALSAFTAADIPEGGEYPEQKLTMAGTVIAKIGKSGVAVKFTEEMLRYSQYDVMSMHLRAAGRAMARHKETKIFNLLNTLGTSIFDNGTAGVQNTSGRGSDGNANATITLDDLLDMYGEILAQGFYANTLIMHPLAWVIFAKDPIMRAFGFNNNGQMWEAPRGGTGLHPQSGEPGGMGPYSQGVNQSSTYTGVPNIFPVQLNVVISPFVPYNSTLNTTSIIMADRSELGVLCIDEDITTEEFEDPLRDLKKIKLRERYGLGILNEGKAIAVAKNIKLTRAFDLDDVITWTAGSGALPAPGTGDIV